MELLLWLYFYDNRWLFNYKVPVRVYKYIWILPIMFHSILISIGVYYLDISHNIQCAGYLKIWSFHRIIFSFLICLNMILFMIKISQAYEKENCHFEKAKKVLPILSDSIHEYDYWIRRNSLFSTSGILLLIQGVISFFWSHMTTGIYNHGGSKSCGPKLHQVLHFHSNFIWYGNFLIMVIFFIMSIIKVFFYVLSILNPCLIVRISSFIYKKRSRLRTYFYEKDTLNFVAMKKLEFTI